MNTNAYGVWLMAYRLLPDIALPAIRHMPSAICARAIARAVFICGFDSSH
jgi:hypothetical protein